MEELITAYINGFFGYGNPKGPYWFLGMEEAAGNDFDADIAPRFDAWDRRGRPHFDDLAEFHHEIGIDHHFVQPVAPSSIQATWRGIMRALLTREGLPLVHENYAHYQAARLGRATDETCLIELLPLPSATIAHWPYGHLDLPQFANRRAYVQEVLPGRIAAIRALIEEHRPRAVVCYGDTYADHWMALAEGVDWAIVGEGIQSACIGPTSIYRIAHPTAFGATAQRWITLGELLRAPSPCE
jgi:hypothetical protein